MKKIIIDGMELYKTSKPQKDLPLSYFLRIFILLILLSLLINR